VILLTTISPVGVAGFYEILITYLSDGTFLDIWLAIEDEGVNRGGVRQVR
jgi:hypothetical protein